MTSPIDLQKLNGLFYGKAETRSVADGSVGVSGKQARIFISLIAIISDKCSPVPDPHSEVHDWDWSSGKPVRGPGRAPGAGDVP